MNDPSDREAKRPEQRLDEILDRDRRYRREAYVFVSAALGHTVQTVGEGRHVTGRELCDGLRDYALRQFGRLARTVLESWGVCRTEDIGEIVFNMVEAGLLRKTEEDTRDDFAGLYDFEEAFDRSFEMHIGSGDVDEPGVET